MSILGTIPIFNFRVALRGIWVIGKGEILQGMSIPILIVRIADIVGGIAIVAIHEDVIEVWTFHLIDFCEF